MKERIDLMVIGGNINRFHDWCRHQEIRPADVIRVSSYDSFHGYKDCEYTIIGSFRFHDEFIYYAQSHNITRMEDHIQHPKIEPTIDWPKELARTEKIEVFKKLYIGEFKNEDDDIPF